MSTIHKGVFFKPSGKKRLCQIFVSFYILETVQSLSQIGQTRYLTFYKGPPLNFGWIQIQGEKKMSSHDHNGQKIHENLGFGIGIEM